MTVRHELADRLSDEDLIVISARRDPVAFETFYDRYERPAFSLAYRLLGSRSAAEEAVQEAFLSVWRSASRFEPSRGSAGAWALGLVRNRAIDILRSRSTAKPRLDQDDDATLELRRSERSTADEAIEHETRREVHGMVDGLPDEQAKVIKLAYFGGFSQTEIAEMLHLPLGTVKGRMRLGLERIRTALPEAP